MKRNSAILSILFIALFGCGQPEESESLKQARKVHEQLNRLSGEFHDALQMTLSEIEGEIEESMSRGDSSLAVQLARIESQLGELDVRFHDWDATVVGIPGDACDHDHDHGDHDHGDHDHAGHDHEGHDHAGHDHDHDHGNEASLEGMSDEDILSIQEALLQEMIGIQSQFDSIVSTLPSISQE
ncbi:MAG: hypothetical protein ACO2XQ_09395 [Flavobacteriales bacterium]